MGLSSLIVFTGEQELLHFAQFISSNMTPDWIKIDPTEQNTFIGKYEALEMPTCCGNKYYTELWVGLLPLRPCTMANKKRSCDQAAADLPPAPAEAL